MVITLTTMPAGRYFPASYYSRGLTSRLILRECIPKLSYASSDKLVFSHVSIKSNKVV